MEKATALAVKDSVCIFAFDLSQVANMELGRVHLPLL